jgi:hypothetical protein
MGLLVDDYADYTDILRRISQKYRMARVFISGSASVYAPWEDNKAQQLIQEIASRLIQEGFGIVSGFGLGVGSHVVNGILGQLDREGTRLLDDRVVLRPFPYHISNPLERKRRWTAYREEILSHAGIALFLFGNKIDSSGNILMAEGVEEEFRIALDKGIFVINDFVTYDPLRGYKKLFEEIGQMGGPIQVASRVVNFIKKLRDEV